MNYNEVCILSNHKVMGENLVAYGFKLPAEWSRKDVEKATKGVIAHCLSVAPLFRYEQHTNILEADITFSDEVFENVKDIISECETIEPDAKIFIAKGYSHFKNERKLYWAVRLIISKEELHRCINICDFFQFSFIEKKFLKGE